MNTLDEQLFTSVITSFMNRRVIRAGSFTVITAHSILIE